jgi:hypothetical protein
MVLIPTEVLSRCRAWPSLKRWERRELGQELRRLGLSYREIASFIPVGKGTLSTWCRDLELNDSQRRRLRGIRPSVETRMRVGHQKRSAALERARFIREAARAEVPILSTDPFWVAGVVAYWAEGAKRPKPELRFSNSDPGMVRLFISFMRSYMEVAEEPFDARLHLHDGQDEMEHQRFWADSIGLPLHCFRKTYVKAEGTGHRKNVLYNGTISIRVRRSGRMYHRMMGWIEGLQDTWAASSTG